MAHPVLSAPHFHNEEAAFAYVEAHLWPEGPVCPHCGNCDGKAIGRLTGKSSRPGLRKCYACRKTFTVRIGSIFEDSHFPLHLWLQAIQLITASKKGISTRQIQRTFNCSMKTAWFLTHRIREIMKPANGGVGSPMGGEGSTLEADLTYVGRKAGTKVHPAPATCGPFWHWLSATARRDLSTCRAFAPTACTRFSTATLRPRANS
jgi:transposase-like protein